MTLTTSQIASPADLAPLSPALWLGTVTLAVADRARSLAFYREFLGLTLLDEGIWQGEPALTLGAGDRAVLRLVVRPGVGRLPRNVTGLYHAAILLPDRVALARIIVRLAEARYPFGASDHAVSEALYLEDPDGNGLEIYWDRPVEEWSWRAGQIQMTTLPLDLESVVSELSDDEPRWAAMPPGTTLGHLHLRVGDAEAAERFYADVLGFDIVASFPGARFMSVAGYHHHLGVNSWESANGQPRSDDTAGLVEWEIVLPDSDALESVASRLAAAGVTTDARADGSLDVFDPWATRLVLRAA
jgi:catechol 2,3-dioxygenase